MEASVPAMLRIVDRDLHMVCDTRALHTCLQALPVEAGHLDVCQQSGHGRGHIHAGQNLQSPCTCLERSGFRV